MHTICLVLRSFCICNKLSTETETVHSWYLPFCMTFTSTFLLHQWGWKSEETGWQFCEFRDKRNAGSKAVLGLSEPKIIHEKQQTGVCSLVNCNLNIWKKALFTPPHNFEWKKAFFLALLSRKLTSKNHGFSLTPMGKLNLFLIDRHCSWAKPISCICLCL